MRIAKDIKPMDVEAGVYRLKLTDGSVKIGIICKYLQYTPEFIDTNGDGQGIPITQYKSIEYLEQIDVN